MRRMWFVFVGLTLLAAASVGISGTPLGPNVNVSQSSDVRNDPQNGPDIAIDPPTRITSWRWRSITRAPWRSPIVAYESMDGGVTWQMTRPPQAVYYNFQAEHVRVAFNSLGDAFIVYRSFGGVPYPAAHWKAAGASTWSNAFICFNNYFCHSEYYAKPSIAIDTHGVVPNPLFIHFANGGGINLAMSIPNGGLIGFWFNFRTVSDTPNVIGNGLSPDTTVSPYGNPLVAWIDSSTAPSVIMTDTGGDWDRLAHTFAADLAGGSQAAIPAAPAGVDFAPSIDADRSTSRAGTEYLAYQDATPSNGLDIFVRRYVQGTFTTAGGWQTPVRVNDDAPGVVQDQFLPHVAVDEVDGSVHVVWYDTRNDAGNTKTDVYYSRSVDGGLTFEPNIKVTTAQSDATIPGAVGAGDRLGLAVHNGIAHIVWTDNRSGKEDIYAANRGTTTSLAISPAASIMRTAGNLDRDGHRCRLARLVGHRDVQRRNEARWERRRSTRPATHRCSPRRSRWARQPPCGPTSPPRIRPS